MTNNIQINLHIERMRKSFHIESMRQYLPIDSYLLLHIDINKDNISLLQIEQIHILIFSLYSLNDTKNSK